MTQEERKAQLFLLIKDENNAVPDKTGNTPLFKQAIRFKKKSQLDGEKMEEIKAISSLTERFNEFDITDFQNFFSYINIGILYNDVLKEDFSSYLKSLSKDKALQSDNPQREALKRIFLIQFLQNIDEFFTDEKLLQDQQIISKFFPLEYAVLISYISLEKSASLLRDLFREHSHYIVIYENRERWLKRFGKEQFTKFLLPLFQLFDNEEKEDFKDFCRINSIPLTNEDRTRIIAEVRFHNELMGGGRRGFKVIPKRVNAGVNIPVFNLLSNKTSTPNSHEKRNLEKQTNRFS